MFNEKFSKLKGFKVFGTLGTDYISKNKINTIMMYMGYGGIHHKRHKHHISIVLIEKSIKVFKCAGREVKHMKLMEEFKFYDDDVLEDMLSNLDRNIDRDKYLISSAEAKILRAEPNSQEFRETVELIEETKESMRSKQEERIRCDLELKRRKYLNE